MSRAAAHQGSGLARSSPRDRPSCKQENFMTENRERDQQSRGEDGIDRRGMLRCMAWVGTGLLWTLHGGLPAARVLGQDAKKAGPNDFSFVQISDSHIGFSKEPNKDVVATLKAAIAKIN